MANITIDGKPYTVKDGITIIEAIDQVNSDVPRYCYHPGLSIAGNCRICQVEVEKMPRTVIACNTRVAEGMVIHTQSAKAKESQQVVLEFLLANHPLDCPVCDQAGECKLQDYYMDYGLYEPQFNEKKVKKTKKAFSIGPTISLDQERCILCSRCVRFADEVTKTHEFGIFNRGDHAELNVYPGIELNNNYSGNVADICPVGALTDKDFRFKMRVWYLGEQESICPGCSRGCNTKIHYEKSRPYKSDKGRVMRLKPRENQSVNKWWMCDVGRYGYKSIDFKRITKIKTPTYQSDAGTNGFLGEAVWNQAFESLAPEISKNKWAVLASAKLTNEDLYVLRKFIRKYKISDVAFRGPKEEGHEDAILLKKDRTPNANGVVEILGLKDDKAAYENIVARLQKGEFYGVIVFEHDLAAEFGENVLKAIRKETKCIVFEGTNENATADVADFVLPAASYAEKDGTFTNFEGRVQRIRKAVQPLGFSRETWRNFADLLSLAGEKNGFVTSENVFNELAKEVSAFKEMTYKAVGKQGALAAISGKR